MSNTDGEDKIESLTLENERLKQAYKYIHASRNNVDKELNEAQQELASLREQLKQKEEVIRELKSFIDKHASHYWNNETLKEYQSLTTKDK